MGHYGHAVQRRLTVEQHDVAVVQVPLNSVTHLCCNTCHKMLANKQQRVGKKERAHLEVTGDALTVPVLEKPLGSIGEADEIGTRPLVDACCRREVKQSTPMQCQCHAEQRALPNGSKRILRVTIQSQYTINCTMCMHHCV